MGQLNESSLSRVWQHAQGDKPFAIITAFRGNLTREESEALNRSLAAEVRNYGYGFFYLDGYWVENQGQPNEEQVVEDSLFVIGNPKSEKAFVDRLVELAAKYDQEAVLIKASNGINVYDSDGNVLEKLNKLSPGKLGTMYSRMRKDGRPFIFEKEADDVGWIGRLAGLKYKK